jgi:hypothetical protein
MPLAGGSTSPWSRAGARTSRAGAPLSGGGIVLSGKTERIIKISPKRRSIHAETGFIDIRLHRKFMIYMNLR